MDVPRQQQLQNDIAERFAASLEGTDWAAATLQLLEVGSVSRLWVDAVDAAGSSRTVGTVPDVVALGGQLREVMADPEKGAWFSLSLTVSRDGSFTARFNLDRRVWVNPGSPFEPGDAGVLPSDADYAADLDRFPRAERYRPEWLPTTAGTGGTASATTASVALPGALTALEGRWGWPGVLESVAQQTATAPVSSVAGATTAGEEGGGTATDSPVLTVDQLAPLVREAVVADVIAPHRVATLLRLHDEAVAAGLLPGVEGAEAVDGDLSLEEARVAAPELVAAVEAAVGQVVDAVVAAHLQQAVEG
ncbi:hypothetical protein ASF82_03100 [Frigoribacterium sp. Leaf164]|uniref:hypothetical protein n=1 Tax=Frigoribacterium sp. Leaf164 TaxID=1736282 RepID=UPI0006F86ACF|nr:hypothetical protein [Frigoribacterium sp. Leaf164]KQR46475.1 hypothetical protein ASF82_03100 [Frigoribacterium sp. Leaf164]